MIQTVIQYIRSWWTIKNRIIVLVSALLGGVCMVVGVVVYQQVRSAQYDKINVRLEALSQKLRDEIDEQAEEHEFPDTTKLQRILSRNLPGSVIQIFDSLGNVCYADSLFSVRQSTLPRQTASQNRYLKSIHLSNIKYRSLWAKIEVLENHTWMLQLATPIENIEEDLERLTFILWTTLLFALFLSAFAVNLVVRRSFSPLSQMIHTADRISASSLHERIPVQGHQDEVSVLGAAINRMIERLEAAFVNQKNFIADASHELRTPLTIIQSELEFAQRSRLSRNAKQSVQIALDELDHVRTLSSNLLLLAKLENQAETIVQCIRLDDLVSDGIARLKSVAREKKISFHLTIDEPVEIQGNADQLQIVFLNIIENALKYSKTKGSIEIHVQRLEREASVIIRDSGVGILPGDLPHIFKPFYRSAASRSETSGSGLGLSIVERIVSMHGGSVEAQSDGKNGSTFIIRLPAGTE